MAKPLTEVGSSICYAALQMMEIEHMAEAFKETLALPNIKRLADAIQNSYASFDSVSYLQVLESQSWHELSLMERLRAASEALVNQLPADKGPELLIAVLQSHEQLSGWLSLICCEYITRCEIPDVAEALDYLSQMTEYFSAEFAIRPLIKKDVETCLAVLQNWTQHDNHHVRRLVSEGTRPRLPWGIRLHEFIEAPQLVLPLLESLRDDPEEYVRRSVANHLNDLAKDHPQLIIDVASNWLNNVPAAVLPNRKKLVRHACRTLLKQGNSQALALFGYLAVDDVHCELMIKNDCIEWQSDLEFELQVRNNAASDNKLMIDYQLHFMKANGKLSPKVFKWLDRIEKGNNQSSFVKKHSFRTVTTRKHYPGLHRLEVYVNGIKKAQTEFELLAE